MQKIKIILTIFKSCHNIALASVTDSPSYFEVKVS